MFASSAAGSYSFGVTYTDDLGQQLVKTYTVTVLPVPTATGSTAVIAKDATYEHTSVVTPLANIVGDGVVTVAPSAGTVTVAGEDVTFDATGAPANVTYTFSVTYTDSVGQTATAEYSVQVLAPLTVTDTTSIIIAEGASHTFNPVVTTDGELEGISLTDPSAGSVSADVSKSEITFDGSGVAASTTPYTFTATFEDNVGQTAEVTYSVTVQAKPTTSNQSATLGVDGLVTFPQDVVTTGSIVSQAIVGSGPAEGIATVTSTGVTYEADGAPAGTYSFSVRYTDNVGQTTEATFTVTVQAKPTSPNQSVTVAEGGSYRFPQTVVTTGTIVSQSLIGDVPAQGTATVDASGVSYDATGAAPGTYSFTVQYTDNVGQTVDVLYTETVQAKPTDTDQSATIAEDSTYTFPQTVVTTGTIVSQELVGDGPAQGTVTVTESGVSFDAAGAAPGTYTFSVLYTDDVGQTVEATFTVTVQAKPTATDITVTAPFGTERIALDIFGVVTGVDLQPLTEASFTAPSSGTLTVTGDGTLAFLPANGFSGTVTFDVSVADGLGQVVIVKVTITIEPQGSIPALIGGLAVTGSGLSPILPISIVLLGLGGLFVIRRNRRHESKH